MVFAFFHKRKNIFPTVRKLNKNAFEINIRNTYNIQFDASSSPLSNDENRSSLFYFYQQLFKKYSLTFIEPRHMRTKQILSKFYY